MADPSQNFAFTPSPRATVAIAGSDKLFPVRRIYCVGRNYAAHVREMGGDERDPPFFFQKPADAVVPSGAVVAYPSATADFQYEIELVLAIGKGGANIAVEDAGRHVFGLAVGIDLTRRDLQLKGRDTGRPWEAGKSFDRSAPIGLIHPLGPGNAALPTSGRIALSVNGQVKQDGDLREMIWRCDEIIAHLSKLFALAPGDLIYTGTPAGVGKIVKGDKVEGLVEGVDTVEISVG